MRDLDDILLTLFLISLFVCGAAIILTTPSGSRSGFLKSHNCELQRREPDSFMFLPNPDGSMTMMPVSGTEHYICDGGVKVAY